MPRRAQPCAQAQRHPPAFAVTKHPYRARSDLRTCLQGRHGSSGIGRQVIDRGRGPVAGRPARAPLVIGEYRHAGLGQMVTQQVKESIVVPV